MLSFLTNFDEALRQVPQGPDRDRLADMLRACISGFQSCLPGESIEGEATAELEKMEIARKEVALLEEKQAIMACLKIQENALEGFGRGAGGND